MAATCRLARALTSKPKPRCCAVSPSATAMPCSTADPCHGDWGRFTPALPAATYASGALQRRRRWPARLCKQHLLGDIACLAASAPGWRRATANRPRRWQRAPNATAGKDGWRRTMAMAFPDNTPPEPVGAAEIESLERGAVLTFAPCPFAVP